MIVLYAKWHNMIDICNRNSIQIRCYCQKETCSRTTHELLCTYILTICISLHTLVDGFADGIHIYAYNLISIKQDAPCLKNFVLIWNMLPTRLVSPLTVQI